MRQEPRKALQFRMALKRIKFTHKVNESETTFHMMHSTRQQTSLSLMDTSVSRAPFDTSDPSSTIASATMMTSRHKLHQLRRRWAHWKRCGGILTWTRITSTYSVEIFRWTFFSGVPKHGPSGSHSLINSRFSSILASDISSRSWWALSKKKKIGTRGCVRCFILSHAYEIWLQLDRRTSLEKWSPSVKLQSSN